MQRRLGTIAIGLIAVLTVGLMSFGTGLASVGDAAGGFGVFADKGGNGNGNGGDNKEKDKGNSNDDKDNDGQGQGNGQGDDDDDAENDQENNGHGNSDKDKEKDNNAGGNGNNGNGNSEKHQDDDSDSDEDVTEGTPPDDDGGKNKVGICHTTGSDSNSTVYIEVSENAVPAHQAHGDKIDVSSEADCEDDGVGTPTPPDDGDGTPTPPGDGEGTPTPPDGTPGATPEL